MHAQVNSTYQEGGGGRVPIEERLCSDEVEVRLLREQRSARMLPPCDRDAPPACVSIPAQDLGPGSVELLRALEPVYADHGTGAPSLRRRRASIVEARHAPARI